MALNVAFKIAGQEINPGEHKTLAIPVANMYTHTSVSIPVHVINGKTSGARLFITAAIHGDEINGVEIIRQLLKLKRIKHLRGTLVAVPVVNIFGFLALSRYLPDRRDLNRSFPGNQKGSLAARLAHILLNEVVKRCTHGIDIHTGAIHRTNLPQTRINLETPGSKELAEAFGAPVIINANVRDGSLRQACSELQIPMLVYEGGEALRFDKSAIHHGLRGVLNVMEYLGMLTPACPNPPAKKNLCKPLITHTTTWIRAETGGIVIAFKHLGTQVTKGETLGLIVNPLIQTEKPIIASANGILISKSNLPLVNEGDAIFHIACFKEHSLQTESLTQFSSLEAMLPEDCSFDEFV